MAKDSAPAFQFYPKDYLCCDRVLEMGLAAQGAYMRMLCKCWLSGSIPADAVKVARLIGFPGQRKAVEEAMELFYEDPEHSNRLRHKRLDEERAHQRRNSEKRRQAARARWDVAKVGKGQQELAVGDGESAAADGEAADSPPGYKEDASACGVHDVCCAEIEHLVCPPSSTPTPSPTAVVREREEGCRGAPSEGECEVYARGCAPPGREGYAESIGREFFALYAGQGWRKQTGEDLLSNKKWMYVLKVRLEAEMRKELERVKRYGQGKGNGRDFCQDDQGIGRKRAAATAGEGNGIKVPQL